MISPHGVLMAIIALFAVLAPSCNGAPRARRGVPRIIVDTDPAMTVLQPQFPFPTDIDDDLALLFALYQQQRGELVIEGIVTTFGNANQSSTHADMLRLAAEAGIQAPIHAGADFNSSLLEKTPGTDFMAASLKHPLNPWEKPPTLVNIGSMHTLASVVSQHPDLVSNLGDVVLLGGTTVMNKPISTNVFANLNFKADPRATNVVLGMPVRKVAIPMDLCMQVLWTQREYDLITQPACADSVASAHLPRIQQWMKQMGNAEYTSFKSWPQYGNATGMFEGDKGTIPWDPLAISYVTNPEWFGDERCFEMQLLISHKIIFSKEMSCDQCAANQWVYCVVVPMTVTQPVAFLDNLTAGLCNTKLVKR
eukprot:TRINITY_DN59879_c0_g2_i3.p1 TRINITY_DN59879_c0_g2~~TRINITY_DN59879_c0_g2_i3.p1  ORF type:complete len:365 (+),score=72.96 TRINITY_DN59879_c0_g2_i3:326-1420(+)